MTLARELSGGPMPRQVRGALCRAPQRKGKKTAHGNPRPSEERRDIETTLTDGARDSSAEEVSKKKNGDWHQKKNCAPTICKDRGSEIHREGETHGIGGGIWEIRVANEEGEIKAGIQRTKGREFPLDNYAQTLRLRCE